MINFKVTDGKDAGQTVTIALKRYHHGFNSGWGVDESNDLMTDGLNKFERSEDGEILITTDELDRTLDFWQHEVDCANESPYDYNGDGLSGTRCGLNPADFKNEPEPSEWCLMVTKE